MEVKKAATFSLFDSTALPEPDSRLLKSLKIGEKSPGFTMVKVSKGTKDSYTSICPPPNIKQIKCQVSAVGLSIKEESRQLRYRREPSCNAWEEPPVSRTPVPSCVFRSIRQSMGVMWRAQGMDISMLPPLKTVGIWQAVVSSSS